ncbi:TolC family protein [Parasphingorhabdus flavimaris]|jgi:outer membrane protein, adhesin transport system|nr:TolC family protein [Parasphingorhabdus flavimaris]
MRISKMKWLAFGSAISALVASNPVSAQTVELVEAVEAALESNPEINQAIQNKEAIEFEREQAQGLFWPRISVEGQAGARKLKNVTRRALGIANQTLYPAELSISGEWTILDGGRRSGELKRQAARTDGAALRVEERSEFIALQVARQYLDLLLQQRIVAASDDNITFHRNLVTDLSEGVRQGSISIADQQQAEERMQAALVRRTEAEEDMVNATIALRSLTGLSISDVAMPGSSRSNVAPTLADAVSLARTGNPKVQEAKADVDAAHAMVQKAKADLAPTIGVEARARAGDDVDGFRGRTSDYMAMVVMRWNIFDGGINRAKVQEMVRRASEARFRLHEMDREAESEARTSWNRLTTQGKLLEELSQQGRVSDDLLISYRQQFNVGRRSLLDVLDAQNTRYNVQVRTETARFSEMFAEFQLLAATNQLLEALNLGAPEAARAYARERYNVGPTPPAETDYRRYPR